MIKKIIIILFINVIFCDIAFADSYLVYNKLGKIINVIVYDGITKYDETVFHGTDAKMIKVNEEAKQKGIGIDDEYKDGKFNKKEIIP